MGTMQSTSYQSASWRGATPYHADTDRMGVCFELPDGQVIRLSISRESAANLVEGVVGYIPEIGFRDKLKGGVAVLRDCSGRGDPERSEWFGGYAKGCDDIARLIDKAFNGEPMPVLWKDRNERPECTQT